MDFYNAVLPVIHTGIRSQNAYRVDQKRFHLKTEHFRIRVDGKNAAQHLQAYLSGQFARNIYICARFNLSFALTWFSSMLTDSYQPSSQYVNPPPPPVAYAPAPYQGEC